MHRSLRDLGVDDAFLRELTELTGGGAVDDPKDVFERGRRQSRIAVELWPWLVGFVTLMIVPEIALRRLGPSALSWFGRRRRRGDPPVNSQEA